MTLGHTMVRFVSSALLVFLCYADTVEAATPTFQEMVKLIAEEERKLKNLTVEAELWQESAPKKGEWAQDKVYCSLTAYFDGMPGSRARIDVHKEVIEWRAGDAPFAESSYSASFDGQVGRWVEFKAGAAGDTGGSSIAELQGEPPQPLRNPFHDYASGAAFSTFLYQNFERRSLSQELSKLADAIAAHPDIPIVVSEEKQDASECYKITMGREDQVQDAWWLDAERGCALLRYRRTATRKDGVQVTLIERHVTKLREVAERIWYPAEAYYYLPPPQKAEEKLRRFHYKASAIKGNSPDFDERIFSVTVPPNYTVVNRIENRIMHTGPTTQALEKDLDDAVQKALKATTQNSGRELHSDNPSTAPSN